MLKRVFLVFLLLTGVGFSQSLTYEVKVRDPGENRVEVGMRIHNIPKEADSIDLFMADRYAFVRLKKPVLNPGIEVEGAVLEPVDPFHWRLLFEDPQEIKVSYTIPLNHRQLPEVVQANDAYEFPYLDEDHGMLSAGAIFMVAKGVAPQNVSLSFLMPESWEVWCPWPRVKKNQYGITSKQQLQDDLIALGHWSTQTLKTGDMEVAMLFAPGQETLEKTAIPLIRKIVTAELKLFARTPYEKYLFLFGRPDTPGFGGSPKTGSMTLCVDKRSASPLFLGHLVAHEFFHLWAGQDYRCPGELRFFNEGFTDYYAYKVCAQEGVCAWSDFSRVLGEAITSCDSNPLKGKISLADAGKEIFFTDQNAYDLVYKGGMIIAALLEKRIRRAKTKQNLDDFMRIFNNDPVRLSDQSAPELSDFYLCLACYLGASETEHIQHLIEKPFHLDPVAEFAAVGVEVKRLSLKYAKRLRANLLDDAPSQLRDLDPKGLAYRLGIRAQDRFVSINGQQPKTKKEVYSWWEKMVESGQIKVEVDRAGKVLTLEQSVPIKIQYDVLWTQG